VGRKSKRAKAKKIQGLEQQATKLEVASPTTSPSRKRPNCDSPTISDELAIKRARNTVAARKSRQAKKDKMISLEQQVAKLTLKNTELETDIKVLQAEKKSLKRKDKDNKNAIKMLECKLTELTEVLK